MTDESNMPRCELCGEPMPEGETMFKFHGFSGPCPAPPLPRSAAINWQTSYERALARIAALEADLARAEDALRQAKSVRDTFALALVGLVDKGDNLQGHQVDKTPNSQVPNDDEVICPNCVHQFRAIPPNVQAELAESDDRARRLAEWLDAERERREAAEKDAARYRWLRGDAPTHSERWPRWNLQRWDGRCWHSLERGALDAAIDAAMKD